MNLKLNNILLVFTLILNVGINAQVNYSSSGYSSYNKHDKSFIATGLRGKHSVSTGIIGSYNSPFGDVTTPGVGIHLGYNYLIVKRAEKYKKKKYKLKTKNYIGRAFGCHIDILSEGELLFTARYYQKRLTLNLGVLSFQAFNEFGIGIHKLPKYLTQKKLTKLNLSLEIMRIKFYKAPLFLHLTTNYDLSNNFLDQERKNIQFMGGLRYYFYKNKYR